MDDKHPPTRPPDLTLDDLAAELPLRRVTAANSDHLIRGQNEKVFRDDFVVPAHEAEDSSEYEKLRPPEGLSPAVRRAITAEPIPLTVEEEPERPLTQFTMTELLWLMSFVCVGFSVMYYLPPNQVAGVLGILALLGQGLLMRFPPESRHIRLGASVLLVMYACAALVAFVQHVFFPATL